MHQKHLAILLSKLEPLQKLDVTLEQYQTESELAAALLWTAFLNGDITRKTVADLGCGNGILGIGAQLLGAKKIYFVDKDAQALTIAKKNAQGKGAYFCGDITQFQNKVDTVVMNPPFGVQKRKADKPFLEQAMQISHTLYSIHKIESKRFVTALAQKHGWHIERIVEKTFPLKRTYAFHTEKKHPIRVGIWILRKNLK